MAREVALIRIAKPTGEYPLAAKEDSRKIFDVNAPYLAHKVVERIQSMIESEDEEKQKQGLDYLAKFQKKFFRDQPTEHINTIKKNGEVNEAFMKNLEKVLGRNLGASDGRRNRRNRVVEAEATIIDGDCDGAGHSAQEGGDDDTGGTPRPVHGGVPRIANGPVAGAKVPTGALPPAPPPPPPPRATSTINGGQR